LDSDVLARFAAIAVIVVVGVHFCAWAIASEAKPVPEAPGACGALLQRMAESGGWVSETDAAPVAVQEAERLGLIRHDGVGGNGYFLTRRGESALAKWTES